MFPVLKQLPRILHQWALNEGVDSEVAMRLLDRFFGVCVASCALLLLVGIPFVFQNKIGSTGVSLLLIGLTLTNWRISRRGNPALAARIFGTAAGTLAAAMLFLGLHTTVALFVFAIATMLIVVLGVRAGTLFAVGYMAAWLLYIVLDAQGMAPPKLFPSPPLTGWMISIISLLLILLPLPELISHMRKAQLSAESASKNKLNALTMMSRHIHGPMNGILGAAQLLEMGQLDADQRELLAGLKSSAAGLQTLLNRLLDYSSIDGGKALFRREIFAWQDLLDRLRSRHAADASASGQRLTLNLDPAMPPTAQGDATRTLQLLDELLTNALSAARSGDVALTVRTSAGGIELEVTDNGPGIHAERLPALFELFADSAGCEGQGLGLPLVAALSRAKGGRIAIDSEPGNTCVRVWLPTTH